MPAQDPQTLGSGTETEGATYTLTLVKAHEQEVNRAFPLLPSLQASAPELLTTGYCQ